MSNSTNIIQFQPNQVPAHIAQARAQGLAPAINANASAGITGGWASIGYKGRNWRLRYRGDEVLLQASAGTDHHGNKLPETPVQSLDVIIVGIAKGVSKQFYIKNFAEGDAEAPDCYSINGVTPDASVEASKRQNDNCSLCPKNRFGSRVTDNGKKAKACADRRRVAVVPDGDPLNESFGGPMMLNMAQSSLANLDRYCRELEKWGTDATQVRTRMSFNLDVAYPEIVFTAVGWVSDPGHWQTVLEWSTSDEVHRMLDEEFDRGIGEIEGAATRTPATSALAAPPPAHIQQTAPVQQAPVAAPAPAPVARPASPFAQAAVKSNGATQVAPGGPPETPPTQPKRGPGRPPGSANKTPPAQAQPAPQPAPQPAAQAAAPSQEEVQEELPGPVIQGVPDDMADTIDGLLK